MSQRGRATGPVAADVEESTLVSLSQSDMNLRDLAVALSSEMEHQAWLTSQRRASHGSALSSCTTLYEEEVRMEDEVNRLRQDLITEREERIQMEGKLQQMVGVQDELRRAKEELSLCLRAMRGNEANLDEKDAILGTLREELHGFGGPPRIQGANMSQDRDEVHEIYVGENSLKELVEQQRREIEGLREELNRSRRQNEALQKAAGEARSSARKVPMGDQSIASALAAKDAALTRLKDELHACKQELDDSRKKVWDQEDIVERMSEEKRELVGIIDQRSVELGRAREQRFCSDEEVVQLKYKRDSLSTQLETQSAKIQELSADLSSVRARLREKDREIKKIRAGSRERDRSTQRETHNPIDWAELAKNLPQLMTMATGVYSVVAPFCRRWGRAGNGIAIILTVIVVIAYVFITSRPHFK